MAKAPGNPSTLKPFPKGVSGNPGGRPIVPQEVKEAKSLSEHEFTKIVSKQFFMNEAQLKEIIENKEENNLNRLVAGIMDRAISQQDVSRAQFLLDRVIGKVKERIEGNLQITDISTHELELFIVEQLRLKGKTECLP